MGDTRRGQMYVETPLIRSDVLSRVAGVEVYLKLENDQPTGSFKLRGNGFHCQKEVELRGCTRLVTASGGNTGIAVAYSGRSLGVPVTAFVLSTTPQTVVDRIRSFGAEVEVVNGDFGLANKRAIEAASKPNCSYIHPSEHADTWEGNGSMIDEIARQLPPGVGKPGCVILSVGGGGMLLGTLLALEKHGWSDVPVVAVETEGADCFNRALKAGKVVELEKVTSLAVTLGAKKVLPEVLEALPRFNVRNYVVSDADAVCSCLRFADDHRILVEPACGAALTVVYRNLLKDVGDLEGPAVVIICGGSGVSLNLLQKWSKKLKIKHPGLTDRAKCCYFKMSKF